MQSPYNHRKGNVGSLFVPLYLVVLAFFILLNAVSTRDEDKEGKAVGSVVRTFTNTKEDIDAPGIEFTKPTGPEVEIFDFFAQIKKLITVEAIELYQQGNTLFLTLKVSDFFKENSPIIKDEQNKFIKHLSETLKKDFQTYYTDVEFSITSPHYLNEDEFTNTDEMLLEISRAGNFARSLEDLGVRPHQILVGIMPFQYKKQGYFTLSFSMRDAKKSKIIPDIPEEDTPTSAEAS